MIKKITIDGFRGLDHLTIDDLGLVNIFVGGNGVGKTSVLEAIALAANAATPAFLNDLALYREMPLPRLASDYALRTLFPQLDTKRTITIELAEEKATHKLKIAAIGDVDTYIGSMNGHLGQISLPSTLRSDDTSQPLYGVSYNYNLSPQRSTRTAALLLHTDGTIERAKTPFSTLGCFYVHARRATSANETAAVVTRLVKEKKRAVLIDVLKLIDPRIADILPETSGGEPIISVDVGLARYVPINVLGDGFCRVVLMVTGMLSLRSKLMVVDEIDSGLHYSVMQSFWQSVLSLTQQFDFQLFATTHSDEMLRYTIDAFAKQPEKLRIYRLDQTSHGISVQKYTYDLIRDSDYAGIEIR